MFILITPVQKMPDLSVGACVLLRNTFTSFEINRSAFLPVIIYVASISSLLKEGAYPEKLHVLYHMIKPSGFFSQP